MRIQQYNDTVTKGEYDIEPVDLYRSFPNTNEDLLQYMLGRKALKDNSEIYKEFETPVRCDDELSVTLKSQAKVSKDDTFDSSFGVSLIQLKLHKKAFKFMEQFSDLLSKEIRNLDSAIVNCKISPFISKGQLFDSDEDDFIFNISDKTSFAKLAIPIRSYESCPFGICVEDCVSAIVNEIHSRLLQRSHITLTDRIHVKRFTQWFESELMDRLLINLNKNGQLGWSDDSLKFTQTVKRNEDDKHDEEYAKSKLYQKLLRRWISINKTAKRIAIEMLHRQRKFHVYGRVIRKANHCVDVCANLGIVDKDFFTFDKYR